MTDEDNDKARILRRWQIAAGMSAGALAGELTAIGVGYDKIPEYQQNVEQVAADNVVKSDGSEHLSPAQAQKALIDATAEELMRRKGIKAIIDKKNNKILFGSVTTGVAIGGATAALLTRRKEQQQQQNETGAAEIS